jgi:hypothetical protein
MAIVEFLTGLLAALLKFAVWVLATLLGLALVSLALAILLGWLLVNRLLGRSPSVTLGGRFQDLRQFGAGFGKSGWRVQTLWPRRAPPQDAGNPEAARAHRIVQGGDVEDVQARELPADRSRS